jgi:hypothetical protein
MVPRSPSQVFSCISTIVPDGGSRVFQGRDMGQRLGHSPQKWDENDENCATVPRDNSLKRFETDLLDCHPF